jgi:hypothetical protein
MVPEIAQIDNQSIEARPVDIGGVRCAGATMDIDPTVRSTRVLRRARYMLPILLLALAGGTTVAGCAEGHAASTDHAAGWTFPASTPADGTTAGTDGAMASDGMAGDQAADGAGAAVDTAWANRPDFTRASAATEVAYRYALDHPTVVQWMPCYCGCAAMGHRSNLDCYFKPTEDGRITFEEHASYCDICVQITLKTRDLVDQGVSLHDARAAIDLAFAGSVPGTPTEVPPQ